MLFGFGVDCCAAREDATLDDVVIVLATPERRRGDVDLVVARVPFEDVDCLFRRLSVAEAVLITICCSGCCCFSTIEAKGRPVVLWDSDMIK